MEAQTRTSICWVVLFVQVGFSCALWANPVAMPLEWYRKETIPDVNNGSLKHVPIKKEPSSSTNLIDDSLKYQTYLIEEPFGMQSSLGWSSFDFLQQSSIPQVGPELHSTHGDMLLLQDRPSPTICLFSIEVFALLVEAFVVARLLRRWCFDARKTFSAWFLMTCFTYLMLLSAISLAAILFDSFSVTLYTVAIVLAIFILEVVIVWFEAQILRYLARKEGYRDDSSPIRMNTALRVSLIGNLTSILVGLVGWGFVVSVI